MDEKKLFFVIPSERNKYDDNWMIVPRQGWLPRKKEVGGHVIQTLGHR
jgi:hypothetical protein